MTLCVAAMCKNREAIVGVADRRLSQQRNDGSTAEHDGQTKIYEPTTYFAALCAGIANYFHDVDSLIREWHDDRAQRIPDSRAPIKEVAKAYQDAIHEILQDNTPAGQAVDPQEVQVIVIGFDTNGGHIIYADGSQTVSWDSVGLCAIGIGNNIALDYLKADGFSGYNSSTEATLLKLYLAKTRVAETTSGVGPATNAIISIPGTQRQIYDGVETKEVLDNYYKTVKEFEQRTLSDFEGRLEGPVERLLG